MKHLAVLLLFVLFSACDGTPSNSHDDRDSTLRYVASSADGKSGTDGGIVLTSCTMSGPHATVALVTTTGSAFVKARDTCPDPEHLINHQAVTVVVDEVLHGELSSPQILRFAYHSNSDFVVDAPNGTQFLVAAREVDGEMYVFSWVAVVAGDGEVAVQTNQNVDDAVDLSSDIVQLRQDFSDASIAACPEAIPVFRYNDDQVLESFFPDPGEVCTPTRPPNTTTTTGTTTSDHVEQD